MRRNARVNDLRHLKLNLFYSIHFHWNTGVISYITMTLFHVSLNHASEQATLQWRGSDKTYNYMLCQPSSFLLMTCAFHAVTCQNVCYEKGLLNNNWWNDLKSVKHLQGIWKGWNDFQVTFCLTNVLQVWSKKVFNK